MQMSYVVTILLLAVLAARSVFYKAYFNEKQRNMGNDPRAVVRKEFPLMWWIF